MRDFSEGGTDRMTADVILVYPYFNEEMDRSVFRYPPLGLGYLASVLRKNGISVGLVDCTFSSFNAAVDAIRRLHPRIVGIYSMVTINHHAVALANRLRDDVELLVAGGPLPTLVPDEFLDAFDVAVLGEGEGTFLQLTQRVLRGQPWHRIAGIASTEGHGAAEVAPRRPFISTLDALPFPARDLFPNAQYQWYWRTFHRYTASSMISTRGCPYLCDFCSNPVFGRSYRERSPGNVVAEMLQIRDLGYDRVFFADDCFTQNPQRVATICQLLIRQQADVEWMCLSRADRLSQDLAAQMRRAGCRRVFFGIESGNQRMLRIMRKQITPALAQRAVETAHRAGIEVGGFFILGYPGETDSSLLDTLRFSSRLPLDYLSYSFPYPILGTGLYSKVHNQISRPEWRKQRGSATRHDLLFHGAFSAGKLRFAMYKGLMQHWLRQRGRTGRATAHVVERMTDCLLRALR
jgi:anaerobic magnesium-protoporphyrin IX monomethyl ester cyclase